MVSQFESTCTILPKKLGWYLDPSSTISSPELDGMANDIFVHIADCIGTQPQVGTRAGVWEERPFDQPVGGEEWGFTVNTKWLYGDDLW